jgi:hypothetical protein
MIIEPDFFQHWKIKTLIERTKRAESPLWLLQFWAHCQTRKAFKFKSLPIGAFKAICGVPSDIEETEWLKILEECGLIEVGSDSITCHDWHKHNAKLVSNWLNGKQEKRKPRVSQHEAKPDNKPVSLPLIGLDRLDRIDRKEKNKSASLPSPVLPFESEHFKEAWGLFLKHRVELKKPLKPTATAMALKFLTDMGEARAIACIEHTVARGWVGLREPETFGGQSGGHGKNFGGHAGQSSLERPGEIWVTHAGAGQTFSPEVPPTVEEVQP